MIFGMPVTVNVNEDNFWSWATLIAKEHGSGVVIALISCMAVVAIVWIVFNRNNKNEP